MSDNSLFQLHLRFVNYYNCICDLRQAGLLKVCLSYEKYPFSLVRERAACSHEQLCIGTARSGNV